MNKKLFAIILSLMLVLTACSGELDNTETTLPDPTTEATQPTETTQATQPIETTQATEPTEESTEPTLPQPEPVSFEEALESQDFRKQREWFYDFARQWRIDYMPQFQLGEKPPVDTHEILYWCFFVNYENWPEGDEFGKMSKDYVEDTVRTYFDTEFNGHQSHFKSWTYDEETEKYTAWPEGGKEDGFYLLNSLIDNGDGTYTVHGTAYALSALYVSEEEEYMLRDNLLNSSGNDETVTSEYEDSYENPPQQLTRFSEFEFTFSMDPETGLPKFHALVVNILNDLYSW